MSDVLLPTVAVAGVAVLLAALAATHPLLGRMAARNALRRRSRIAIVTFGLLIGTAIIASSLAVGDTLEFIFTGDVYERLDAIDVTVSHEVDGQPFDFPEAYFHTLQTEAEARAVAFDGMAPVLLKTMPVRNEDTVKGNQAVTVVGVAEAYEDGFGSLRTRSGAAVSTSDLGPGWVYANEAAAADLEAVSGNRLTLFFGTTNQTLVRARVADVVRDEGKAAYEHEPLLFMPLRDAQGAFDAAGEINLVKVSVPGPAVGGEAGSGKLARGLRGVVGLHGWTLEVREVKRDALGEARLLADQATELFLVMGSFAIFAGVLLLVNLFVMLAEERKAEMGVSRAVGMKRVHLMMTFLFEGSLYAAIAASVGTVAGLGLGWLMVQIFNAVFVAGDGTPALTFHFEPDSVVLAFAAGVLITLAAVAIASASVSRLNIVRAIRKLPEPPAERLTGVYRWLVFLTIFGGTALFIRGFTLLRLPGPSLDPMALLWAAAAVMLVGLVGYLAYKVTDRESVARIAARIFGAALAGLVVAGAYDMLVLPPGADESIGAYRIAAVPVTLLGLAILGSRRGAPRLSFSLAGLGTLWWLLMPPIDLVDEARDNVSVLFVETGVLLVFGAVLLAAFNTSPLLRAALNRTGRGRPVVRTAVSYPMGKRFQTGMTIAMFAMIIFSITVIAMVQGLQAASLDKVVAGQSGGYQVVAYAQGYVPIDDFPGEMVRRGVPLDNFLNGREGVATATVLSVRMNKSDDPEARDYTLWGVDNFLIERNTYDFQSFLPRIAYVDGGGARREIALATREDVWTALRLNDSYAVVDRGAAGADQFTPDFGQLRLNLGDRVWAADGAGNGRAFVILGILQQSLQFTRGVFVDRETVLDTYDLSVTRTAYFFQLASGADGDAVRAALEGAFFEFGLITLDIREEIATQFQESDRVLLLMQAYLAIGLLVGITGLGVITIRAVVERRQEIGALRALGFTRAMIRGVFLFEIVLISALGIAIGMALGVVLSFNVYRVYFASVAVFTIPWLHLAGVAAIALAATVLTTATPALRAAKLPPAEALRYIE